MAGGIAGAQHGGQRCMYHAEVVEASRGNHAVVGTYGLCRSGVVEREIVVDYFILVDVEFVRYGSAHESFGILFGEGDNGNHVALFRQRVAFVDTAVEMDCKMRNGEKRLAETYQPVCRAQRIGAADDNASCNRQRTVEPCVKNRASVHFHVQTEGTSGRWHLAAGFQPQPR